MRNCCALLIKPGGEWVQKVTLDTKLGGLGWFGYLEAGGEKRIWPGLSGIVARE
jgi:hypothetical protein